MVAAVAPALEAWGTLTTVHCQWRLAMEDRECLRRKAHTGKDRAVNLSVRQAAMDHGQGQW